MKPKVGIIKLSSCDGCQAVFLDLHEFWENFEVDFWILGKTKRTLTSLDIAFIEGSVSTPEEEEFVKEVRSKTKTLVAIGACAISGGIQALRNFEEIHEYLKIYPKPNYIKILDKSTPVKSHVKVDYEIHGCPINSRILENFLKAYLHNKRPYIPDFPLCMECKRKMNVCVMDAYGIPCLGPVTRAGCGSLCPSVKRGCYGCFGPFSGANVEVLVEWFKKLGISDEDIKNMFSNENSYSEEFRKVLEGKIEKPKD